MNGQGLYPNGSIATEPVPESGPGQGRGSAAAAICASWFAVLVFLWPGEHVLWAGALSSASFIIAPILFPLAGWGGFRVSPVNWLRFGFGLQLVVVPLCVRVAGPSQFLLDALPSDTSINLALLLNTMAFWAFCGGYHSFSAGRVHRDPPRNPDAGWVPGRTLCVLFVCIGLAGLMLKFGSLSHFVTYLTDPVEFLTSALGDAPESATLTEAASTFLNTFLGFGCVLFWCRAVDPREGGGGFLRGLRRAALIAAVALSYSMMSYNRGSVAVPMVALAAAVSKGLPGAALRYLIVTAATLGIVLVSLTLYRTLNSGDATDSSSVSLLEAGGYINAMATFQVYGQAPQFLGAALAEGNLTPAPLLGRTLISSVLSPAPLLGKPFRESSGVLLYNRALGRGEFPDQIPQFAYELFRDFHVFGVVAGFAVLGWFVALLQARFELTHAALHAYLLQYAAVWLGFLTVGGIEVLAQLAISTGPPVYIFLWTRRCALKRLERRTGSPLKRTTGLPRVGRGEALP